MAELVRAGRSADRLTKELEPSVTAIRRWTKRAGMDGKLRKDGPTTAECRHVHELKRELCRVWGERDILATVAA